MNKQEIIARLREHEGALRRLEASQADEAIANSVDDVSPHPECPLEKVLKHHSLQTG